ncbi:MAG TPA: hypothetical protein VHQ90_10440 [Thermoanaerobaculia bacterium]|nr:hypothetical protein [Thermoanaerobaculia bacterium]
MLRAQAAGLWIAVAAILVQAPRLVLVLLAADRQAVSVGWEDALLVVAGVGTALVLTGGNLYLALTVASTGRWRGRLTLVWLAILVASGGLVVPNIAAGLSARALPQVLHSPELQWGWALLAALAHEITAAGCMLAAAARGADVATAANRRQVVGELAVQRSEERRERRDLRQAAAEVAGPAAASQRLRLAEPVACREGCGRSFDSVLAEMGHLRHCPVRLERRRKEGPG